MKLSALDVLCCPFCSGAFKVNGSEQITGELEYGVLSCYCGRYPVVAGIPILKKGGMKKGNSNTPTTADEVVDLIEAGRHREALLAVLMPPAAEGAELAPSWIRALPSFRGMGKLKGLFGRGELRRWREQGEALFTATTDNLTIKDLLEFYFRHMGEHGSKNYINYSFRMGQPRQLIAVSLASIIDQPKGPILDLACGFGHVTRHLVRRAKGQLVFGADIDFFSLWIAKTWLAPGAQYVCVVADTSVPLKDRSCSLAFCSDAFWLFLHQATCLRELKRLSQEDGVIILTGLRNGLVKKHLYSGSILPALPPEGYRALVADMPHRLVDNRAIMDRYLKKQGPPLAFQTDLGQLADVQWISLVASHRTELFYDYPAFEEWPHALDGQLRLNPLYREEAKNGSDKMILRRVYPSAWYEQENASESPQYLPETACISLKEMEALAQKKRTPEIERLIEQGVVVGIPEPYLRLAHA